MTYEEKRQKMIDAVPEVAKSTFDFRVLDQGVLLQNHKDFRLRLIRKRLLNMMSI